MSQSIGNLAIGSLVEESGTAINGTPLRWRVIGKNHDATNSVTLMIDTWLPNIPTATNTYTPRSNYSMKSLYNYANYGNSYIRDWINNSGTNTWANEYLGNYGLLYYFSSRFKNKMKDMTKGWVTSIGGNSFTNGKVDSETAKVFLLSVNELNGGSVSYKNMFDVSYKEGEQYDYFKSTNKLTDICNKTGGPWLRTAVSAGTSTSSSANNFFYCIKIKSGEGKLDASFNAKYNQTFLFHICVADDIKVSDTVDSNGVYQVVWNASPVISTPSTNLGDKTKAFSTTFKVTDADNDTVSATVKLDGTTIQTIASVTLGADNIIAIDATTFRNLTLGSHTISIIANDGTESVTKTITFQKVSGMGISGSDGDLGNKWIQPTITYQVYDDNDLQVDITEKIDGEIVKELEDAPLNTDITFDMSVFNGLTPEQQHTLKIEAVNADESTATRTWTFTKLYQYLEFYTDTVETDISAERIYVVLDYDKTNNPEIQVLVCNDAGGTEWHYEDATEDVLNGQPHTFHYTPAEGTEGVSVMVRIIKNENTERVYFNNIGFTFS